MHKAIQHKPEQNVRVPTSQHREIDTLYNLLKQI